MSLFLSFTFSLSLIIRPTYNITKCKTYSLPLSFTVCGTANGKRKKKHRKIERGFSMVKGMMKRNCRNFLPISTALFKVKFVLSIIIFREKKTKWRGERTKSSRDRAKKKRGMTLKRVCQMMWFMLNVFLKFHVSIAKKMKLNLNVCVLRL